LLLDFSCTDAAGPSGVFDSVVVVTLDGGLTITTGGLTTVVFVTVSLVAAGMVVTVLSDSVVCDHALPAKPTATPIAAAEIHNPRDFISFNLMFSDQLFRKSPRNAYTLRHRASLGRCQSDELLSCTQCAGCRNVIRAFSWSPPMVSLESSGYINVDAGAIGSRRELVTWSTKRVDPEFRRPKESVGVTLCRPRVLTKGRFHPGN